MKTRVIALWDYFKQKGPLPDSMGIFSKSNRSPAFCSCDKTQLSRTMLVLYWCHHRFTNHRYLGFVNLWCHGPQLWSLKPDCLIVLISLCGEKTCETRLDHRCSISHWAQLTADFKFARVVRSRYLVSLLFCYVLPCWSVEGSILLFRFINLTSIFHIL